MKQYRKILKVSFLIIAFAISLAILSACNGTGTQLPSEHFDGNCITKGYTRYYMPNGTYVDREDKEFGEHSYGEGVLISERTCTQDEITRYTCEICKTDRFDTVEKYGHDYEQIDRLEPDCVKDGYADFKCGRCLETYRQPLDRLGHDFNEEILKQPTCSVKGSKKLICQRKDCGHSEIADVDTLPHTPGLEIYNDDVAHWQKCTVCDNTCAYEKHSTISFTEPSTCTTHAYTVKFCTVCPYEHTEVDTSSALAHRYEAYTCVECQRDNLLDYIDEFKSHGNSQQDPIDIKNDNMLVCFYDWIIAYQISTQKYFKVASYRTVLKTEARDFLNEIRHKTTATNWNIKFTQYSGSDDIVQYFSMCAYNEGNFKFSEVATTTPDKYEATTYEQYNSYQFVPKSLVRSDSFDDFKYKSRKNEMTVTSSDQLFFAFEHGYFPKPTSNSAATRMLEKAKAVARRIMDDTMSDFDKVRAIYSWLVSDVAYDYGVVELGNSNSDLAFAKYSSYYLEGVFDHQIAVCDGIAKAFCVLAGLEDIKCVRVTSINHAWNKVYIDVNGDGHKQWFCSDATWGNQALNNNPYGEYLSLVDFLFTDEQKIAKKQTGLNYVDSNSNATTVENPFEYFYFDESKTDAVDFVIETEAELIALVKYLQAHYSDYDKNSKITVQMFVVKSYCPRENISNLISDILHKNWFIGAAASMTIGEYIDYDGTVGFSLSLIFTRL